MTMVSFLGVEGSLSAVKLWSRIQRSPVSLYSPLRYSLLEDVVPTWYRG